MFMVTQSIQFIVDRLIDQYKSYGASDKTVEALRDSYCGPIISFINEQNKGIFSTNLLNEYVGKYQIAYEKNEISRNYYSTIYRTAKLIMDIANNGVADFSRKKVSKKYLPSPEHMKMVDEIIKINKIPLKSANDIHMYIRKVFCYIELKGVLDQDITDDIFFEYLKSTSESNKGSRSKVMRAVRMTSSYLKENGASKLHTDFSLLPIRRATIHIVPPYSQDELNQIFAAIDLTTELGKRNYAIIYLALETGLRGADIVALKLQDIDWRKETISIRQSKTKEPIVQPVSGEVLNSIADYILDVRPDSSENAVFLSTHPPFKALKNSHAIGTMFESLCKKAGVPKIPGRSFHSIRRTFATELSLKGTSIYEISELLGHRDLRSDKSYLSYNRQNISFVAGNFGEVPIRGGIYAQFINKKCNVGGL